MDLDGILTQTRPIYMTENLGPVHVTSTNYELNNLSSICETVWLKKLEDVVKVLQEHPNLNETMRNGRSALFYAVERGVIDIAIVLIQHGALVNISDGRGLTPLHVACYLRDKDMVSLLLSKDADIHADSEIGTPILAATRVPGPMASAYSHDVVRALIDHGANVNDKLIPRQGSLTALHFAVEAGDAGLVSLLLAAKADVNVKGTGFDKGNFPLLHVAISTKKEDIVRLFLEDTRFNMKFECCWDPLSFACMVGNLPIVKLLAEKGFNANMLTYFNDKPLSVALKYENFKVALYLLEQSGISLFNPKASKIHPLAIALEVGKTLPEYQQSLKEKVVKKIIDKIEDLNKELCLPLLRKTALSIAARNQDISAAKYLIKKGADVNYMSEMDEKSLRLLNFYSEGEKISLCLPILFACECKGNIEMIKLLLLHGAQLNVGPEDLRPLIYALQTCEFEVVKLLVDHGAEVNQSHVDYWRSWERDLERDVAQVKRIDEMLRCIVKA